MIADVKNVPSVMTMKTPFGCAGRRQQQYYQAVLPLAVLIREGERSNPSPACVDNDGYPAAFILKWLTPHSVPSA